MASISRPSPSPRIAHVDRIPPVHQREPGVAYLVLAQPWHVRLREWLRARPTPPQLEEPHE